MEFFDTHLHTDEISDAETFVSDAISVGVTRFLACGTSLVNSEKTAAFAERFPGKVFFAAGVQPLEAETYDGNPAPFGKLCELSACRAVGEIGIDTYYDGAPLEKQTVVFRDMLKLALEKNLPAIVHCRAKDGCTDAYDVCYSELSAFASSGGKFELHCFTGTMDFMKKFADLGAYFGVGGMITFRRADNIRELASAMAEDRILLETDSPYLAPVPHRGVRNESKYLVFSAEKLAEVRLVSVEDAARFTTENALRFLDGKGA